MDRTLGVLVVLLLAQVAAGQERMAKQDPNLPIRRNHDVATMVAMEADAARATEIARDEVTEVVASQTASAPALCAIVVLPGPARRFDIRFGVFNVAAEALEVLSLDSFAALKRQSILHESVFDTVAPAGGRLQVLYPTESPGQLGIVLGFANFTQFNSAAFNTDPDSYDDPDLGITVADLNETTIEAVYSEGLRCRGSLSFDAKQNAAVARLMQVSATTKSGH